MDVIVLDDSLAETPIDDDPTEIESVEQLLQRANASIAAFDATRKRPLTVPTVTIRASSEMEAAIQSSNGASRNLNECDDDVIFVGESVINLCSPDKGRCRNGGRTVARFPDDSEPKENTVMCAVCMDSSVGRQPHSTNCGHIFCGSCIKEAIKLNRKCPLCNKGLTMKNIFPVFI